MIKNLFLTFTFLLVLCSANAQNSDLEIAQRETKVTKFKKDVDFYKEKTVSHYWEEDVDIYGKVFTDLKNPSNSIGALEIRTNNEGALRVFTQLDGFDRGDKESRALGYVDYEEIDNLRLCLETIKKESELKTDDDVIINYIAPGGLSVYYINDDNKFFFRKEWYFTNRVGTLSSMFTDSGILEVDESLSSLIKYLIESKTKIDEEIARK